MEIIKKKSILITGSNGFIGKNLVSFLQKKYKVYAPLKKDLNLLETVQVDNYFKNHKIDIVIHCAVVGGSRKEEKKENELFENLKMFFNIVKNKNRFERMINIGSGSEYNKKHSIKKVKESNFGKLIPEDDYGFFKYICSQYIKDNNNLLNLRVFGLYGQGEDYRYRFISNAICKCLYGLPIKINQNAYFEYVYIKDFVKIVGYFIENKPKFSFYNVGRNKKIDLLTISKELINLTGSKQKIIIEKKGLNKEYTCDSSLLLKEIGNFKFTEFKKSLIELINWYKKMKKNIDLNVLR